MSWRPWDGCYAAGDGCINCYFYGQHSKRHDWNKIIRASDEEFYAPLNKDKFKSGDIVGVCFSSDFFIPDADEWRKEAWDIIKERSDMIFRFLTKRIDRFLVSLPDDWGEGYDNVEIGIGVENQETADYRLPLCLSYPIKNKFLVATPLIGKVDLSPYLHEFTHLVVGGEWAMGGEAREFNYDWALSLREQCKNADITFEFGQTGQRFRKDGVLHKISPFRKKQSKKDLGINDIDVYVKADIEEALAKKNISINSEPDKAFLLAFNKAIFELGYDFRTVIGSGTVSDPVMIYYSKLGTHNSPAARIYIIEGKVLLKLLVPKITPSNHKYIESAPLHIQKVYTNFHDDCAACLKKCRTQNKYAINGRFIQKCKPERYFEPSLENLPDYMKLLIEFFPVTE